MESSDSGHLYSILSDLERSIKPKDETAPEGVRSLRDGISYWDSRKDSAALQYSHALRNLSVKLEQLAEYSIEQISDFIESAEDCLDQLWLSEPPFPQNRMQQLINSTGLEIANCIISKVNSNERWQAGVPTTDLLQAANSVCEQWKFVVESLVEQWKQNVDAPWKGDKPAMAAMEILQKQINEILSLQMLSSQVSELLGDKSSAWKEMDAALRAIFAVRPLLAYSASMQQHWRVKLMVICCICPGLKNASSQHFLSIPPQAMIVK
ncbi:unnamed protein product [Gongylonema pulchrum]|uniref:DHC_N1 domain-containing protein n=1 Tax=Gongylonema pulchrum TaxID=637853 RepID=A0A3P7LUW1_9BILA|nr:unnamed protein product [Gongylonema pulchrum]